MVSVDYYQRLMTDQKNDEKKGFGWGTVNSGLLSGYYPFQQRFQAVLPDGRNIKDYIEDTFAYKKGGVTGLELGGIGSKLFSEFTPGFFKQTFGLTLVDNRNLYSNLDEGPNHHVLEGNIFSDDTIKSVKTELPASGVDVVLESMVGGLAYVPNEVDFFTNFAGQWYQLIAEGGLALIEMPDNLDPYMPFWVKYLKKNFSGRLDVDYDSDYEVLRLRKLEGSPETLPVLGYGQLKDILRAERARNNKRLQMDELL